jgi:hypothetical protein
MAMKRRRSHTNHRAFHHRALVLRERRPLVYTAMSKHSFCYRTLVSKFVFESQRVPINPALNFDFGFHGLVKKDDVLTGNNNLLRAADEVWVFGPISDGVYAEMLLAKDFDLSVRYFSIDGSWTIREVAPAELVFEPDVVHRVGEVPTTAKSVMQDNDDGLRNIA